MKREVIIKHRFYIYTEGSIKCEEGGFFEIFPIHTSKDGRYCGRKCKYKDDAYCRLFNHILTAKGEQRNRLVDCTNGELNDLIIIRKYKSRSRNESRV